MRSILLIGIGVTLFACNSDKKVEPNQVDTTNQASAPPTSGKIDIETFGDLKIGQNHKETTRILSAPEIMATPIEWEADGLMHSDWTYRAKGLALNMTHEIGREDSTKVIFSIKASAPCTYKTRAGIGIGSTYEEVQAAYKRDINTEMSTPEQIIVGQIYGGIFFTFGTDRKVNQVFLGSAAE